MKVLLTSGATREPIDSVRFISNVSTGATGATLADSLAEAGHEVTLLHGIGAVRARHVGVVAGEFSSAAHLGERLRAALATGGYQAVIQAAAVADYRPVVSHTGKLGSDAASLTLDLAPTPKLLPMIKTWSPSPVRVLGFKLTAGADAEARAGAVGRLFTAGGIDAVVHNDLDEVTAAGAGRTFRIYQVGAGSAEVRLVGVPALADWLTAWVVGH